MSNYIKNTKNILKSFNENVVKPQLLNVDGKVGALSTDIEGKLTALKTYVDGQDAQVLADAKAHAEGQVAIVDGKVVALQGEVAGHVSTLEGAIQGLDTKVEGHVATINGTISALDGRVSVNETDIANLKSALSNKNNNTIVIDTMEQLPQDGVKTGDIAFVIEAKRVMVYNGTEWVVLDTITNEVDLVDYAKIEFVDGKIAEVNGTITTVKSELEAECGLKATKVELADEVAGLNERIDGLVINGGDTTAELEALKVRVTANEGSIANHEGRVAELERALSEDEIAEIIAFVLA